MKYHTENELEHFGFAEAYIAQVRAASELFWMVLDNVKILPENSCNRDIRKMRTNQLLFKIQQARILSLVEEGYNVYDADGKLLRREPDRPVEPEAYLQEFQNLEGCAVYSIEHSEGVYVISIDTEDHTYMMRVAGSGDTQEWDLFLQL